MHIVHQQHCPFLPLQEDEVKLKKTAVVARFGKEKMKVVMLSDSVAQGVSKFRRERRR